MHLITSSVLRKQSAGRKVDLGRGSVTSSSDRALKSQILPPFQPNVVLYEVSFRFRHHCPFNALSMKYPHAMISVWDNYKREFIELRSKDGELGPDLDKEMEAFAHSKGSRILQRSSDSSGTRFLAMTCACKKSGSTVVSLFSMRT